MLANTFSTKCGGSSCFAEKAHFVKPRPRGVGRAKPRPTGRPKCTSAGAHREKAARAGEEGTRLVGHEQRLAAGKRHARRVRIFLCQEIELPAPRKRVLAVVGELLLVGVEAKPTIAMAVVGKHVRTAGARPRTGNASPAQRPQRNAGSAVAHPRSNAPQLLQQLSTSRTHLVARRERNACTRKRTHMVGRDVPVKADRTIQRGIVNLEVARAFRHGLPRLCKERSEQPRHRPIQRQTSLLFQQAGKARGEGKHVVMHESAICSTGTAFGKVLHRRATFERLRDSRFESRQILQQLEFRGNVVKRLVGALRLASPHALQNRSTAMLRGFTNMRGCTPSSIARQYPS